MIIILLSTVSIALLSPEVLLDEIKEEPPNERYGGPPLLSPPLISAFLSRLTSAFVPSLRATGSKSFASANVPEGNVCLALGCTLVGVGYREDNDGAMTGGIRGTEDVECKA